jgi:hypothetical protein
MPQGRAHHEAWLQSELNQREYCEAYRIPIKAFGNWRARFKAEPHPPARKVLYRRGGVSHALSHNLSHGLSHDLSKRGKTRGGMIIRFTRGRESDSFWACRRLRILIVCRTPS